LTTKAVDYATVPMFVDRGGMQPAFTWGSNA
jgi:hypothetical protein